MKFLSLAAAAGLALIGSAMPGYADCSPGRFSGPYVGATLGIGRLDASQSSPGETDRARGRSSAVVPGGVIGYGIRCGNIVSGIEADLSYLGIKSNSSWPDPIFLRSKIDWMGTLRGRLGVLVRDDVLLYGTAGLAFADVAHTLESPTFAFSQTDTSWRTGWTLGGGLEFAHSERVNFRAEALYVDLGADNRSYTACGGCFGDARWTDKFWVARLGMTFKLGDEPTAYAPLK